MKTVFKVENIKCGGCTANIETLLGEIPEIQSLDVSLENKTVTIEGTIDANEIAKLITAAGYPAST